MALLSLFGSMATSCDRCHESIGCKCITIMITLPNCSTINQSLCPDCALHVMNAIMPVEELVQ
jgi:hypothetical protein